MNSNMEVLTSLSQQVVRIERVQCSGELYGDFMCEFIRFAIRRIVHSAQMKGSGAGGE